MQPWYADETQKGVQADGGTFMADDRENRPIGSEPDISDQPVLLVSIQDGLEAGMIESLLREHDIPVLRKYPETGQVLHLVMGTSIYGTELHVPADRFDEAYRLLEGIGVFATSDAPDGLGEAEPEEWHADSSEPASVDPDDPSREAGDIR